MGRNRIFDLGFQTLIRPLIRHKHAKTHLTYSKIKAKFTSKKSQRNNSKEKETIYYILKTTYNVSHWTTIYIEPCDLVTLGRVIYLLYIVSYRKREGRQSIIFCLYCSRSSIKKQITDFTRQEWRHKKTVDKRLTNKRKSQQKETLNPYNEFFRSAKRFFFFNSYVVNLISQYQDKWDGLRYFLGDIHKNRNYVHINLGNGFYFRCKCVRSTMLKDDTGNKKGTRDHSQLPERQAEGPQNLLKKLHSTPG